eukprot:COSAG03_NODE_4132_length_1672_cov_1.076287_2_plen_239_part_00
MASSDSAAKRALLSRFRAHPREEARILEQEQEVAGLLRCHLRQRPASPGRSSAPTANRQLDAPAAAAGPASPGMARACRARSLCLSLSHSVSHSYSHPPLAGPTYSRLRPPSHAHAGPARQAPSCTVRAPGPRATIHTLSTSIPAVAASDPGGDPSGRVVCRPPHTSTSTPTGVWIHIAEQVVSISLGLSPSGHHASGCECAVGGSLESRLSFRILSKIEGHLQTSNGGSRARSVFDF